MKTKLTSWGRLFRLPNIFTVPGDPLIGFIVLNRGVITESQGIDIILVMLASVCLYIYGLISNDIVDYDIDKKERSSRPLASGEISIASAKIASCFFVCIALLISFFINQQVFILSLVLLAFISFYNFKYKSHIILGPLLLALCRITNVMFGATLIVNENVVLQPLFFMLPTLFFYIYGVSIVAQKETNSGISRKGRLPILAAIFIVMLTLLMFAIVILFELPENSKASVLTNVWGMCLYLWFAAVSFHHVMIFTREQPPVVIQKGVGTLIRNLMFFQAAWCAFSGSSMIACVLVVLAYNAKLASNKFYGS